jgi:hypothetical protein
VKHLSYFKESNGVNLEKFKDDVIKVFENPEWLVIKPKSYEALCFWCEDVWRVMDYEHKYLNSKEAYININKKNDKKILFDFENQDFLDEDDTNIELKEFFEINKDLFKVYGEIVKCSDIVKEGEDYWIVVTDYDYFTDYFKLDNSIRNDYIKTMLSNDYFNIYSYSPSDFSIKDFYGELDKENFLTVKIILILEKDANDYDYDVDDIKDYDDVVDIIKDYDLDELKKIFKHSICEAHERADADVAYNHITDEIYDFFNLDLGPGSTKWEYHNNSKYQKLWIRFKTKESAYYAKFLIIGYDDSYSDDKIDFGTHGYYGDSKDVESYFNEKLDSEICEYDDTVTYDEIKEYRELWVKTQEKFPNYTNIELMKEMEFRLNAKRYNL